MSWSLKSPCSIILSVLLLVLSFFAFQSFSCKGSETHDVAVIDLVFSPSGCVCLKTLLNTNTTVQNQGTTDENFNVTLNVNNVTIQTFTVDDLASMSNVTLTLNWELFAFKYDIFPYAQCNGSLHRIMSENASLKAEADVVLGEMDTSDNVLIVDAFIVLWMRVDVNGDGRINMKDIGRIAWAFGSHPWEPRWDPLLDFNCDGIIDMKEVAAVARVFGLVYCC